MDSKLYVCIMAGGQGKRMKSLIPKFLHKIQDQEMIVYIIKACLDLSKLEKIYIILGSLVMEQCMYLHELFPNRLEFIEQKVPLGTGNALQCLYNSKNKLFLDNDTVLVLNADMPFIQSFILKALLEQTKGRSGIIGAFLNNPKGYGRIIMKNKFELDCIKEDKDCKDASNNFCNMGVYSFCMDNLKNYLHQLDDNNASKEFYLTQIFDFIPETIVYAVSDKDIKYLKGVNNPEELQEISVEMSEFK